MVLRLFVTGPVKTGHVDMIFAYFFKLPLLILFYTNTVAMIMKTSTFKVTECKYSVLASLE